MTTRDDPRTFHLESIGEDDWVIVDDYGEQVDEWKYRTRKMSHQTAREELSLMVSDYLENYEPPEHGDTWTGGFAENH